MYVPGLGIVSVTPGSDTEEIIPYSIVGMLYRETKQLHFMHTTDHILNGAHLPISEHGEKYCNAVDYDYV